MDGNEACIVLANGRVFEGKSFGASACAVGEAVFTTGMNGYIETLTDPSYFGQIVTQTFPLIGNYGIIERDFESASCHMRGYVASEICESPSNFRCGGTVADFLKARNIPGICGIDTRALTKILREAGVMNAMIIAGRSQEAEDAMSALRDESKKEALLQKIKSYKIQNAVESVSRAARAIEESASVVFKESAEYRFVPVTESGAKVYDERRAMAAGRGKRVALWDFGAKANIRRELLKRGFDVEVLPSSCSAREILSSRFDGLMLSNGPGDPEDNPRIIEELRKIMESRLPTFGICLGHQLLALAAGAKTRKLKYGHRGANQPVKRLGSGRVYITSQNHGYAVENGSLPDGAEMSFVNANDGTCEGITYKRFPAFSVQFHPEACAGPLDTSFLFDDFARLIESGPRG